MIDDEKNWHNTTPTKYKHFFAVCLNKIMEYSSVVHSNRENSLCKRTPYKNDL